MKKVLIAILTCLIALGTVFCVGCEGNNGWKGTNLKTPGDFKANYGFIAETDNYLYFINGVAENSDSNTFGAPIKGSLMALDKNSIGTDNLVQEIVVPKLFITESFGSGLFFNDGYVYYTTPSTDKNASGHIAFDNMTFARSSLDGTKNEELFTVSSFGFNYRFYESEGAVSIVYLDNVDNKLVRYDVNSKASTVIALTDDKVNTLSELTNEYLSLDTAKVIFAEDGVYFIEKVYSFPYSQEQASSSSYSRQTAKYNRLFKLDAKGKVKKVSENKNTFALSYLVDGYVFYTETDVYSTVKTFAVKNDKPTEIINASNLKENMILKEAEGDLFAYFIDTDKTLLVYTTLTGDEKTERVNVCSSADMASLLFINGNYMYFVGGDTKIYRRDITVSKAENVLVTEDVIDGTWYAPVIAKIKDTEYLFYINDSVVGSGYVNYIDITNAQEKPIDETAEVIKYTLGASSSLGIMTDKDTANKINFAINQIGATLTLEKDGDALADKSVAEARKTYDEMTEQNSKLADFVTANDLTKLQNAEKAVELANLYAKLQADFNSMDSSAKDAYKNNQTYIEALKKANEYRQTLFDLGDEGATYTAVRNMIPDRYNFYYQEASKLMATK